MSNSNPIQASIEAIFSLHKNAILRWEKDSTLNGPMPIDGLLALVEENHHFNFTLWHAEDRARREDKGPEFVYFAKREIDAANQARNNRMEAIDTWLFNALSPAQDASCSVHSETPGMMIDRLSIMVLKAHYMRAQTARLEVDEAHVQQCQQKLVTIEKQQQQLSTCLIELLAEVHAKTRTFKVYHQFKMYNDPRLNPELYGSKR